MMRVHAICYYRAKSDLWTGKWRNEDYAARNLVKAVKHMDFNGNSMITAGGSSFQIDNTPNGRAKALSIIGSVIAAKMAQAGYTSATVIPIPSSSHTEPTAIFTGRRMADSIQKANAAFGSAPVLYFDQPLPKSAGGGGSRNPLLIQSHLRIIAGKPNAKAVLIDDVFTTGGHLKAAARFLAANGIQVEDAFVIGRTTWTEPQNMFSVPPEELITTDLLQF